MSLVKELPPNYIPSFKSSGDRVRDLKMLIILESISFAMLKGKFERHMREIGAVKTIDDRELFTDIEIHADDSRNFFNKEHRGYHIAEVLRMVGYEDEDLKQITDANEADGVSYVRQNWKWKNELTESTFKDFADYLNDSIQDVDEIQFDMTFLAYDKDEYPTDEDRPYKPKDEVYDDELPLMQDMSITERDSYGTDNGDLTYRKKNSGLWGEIRLLSGGEDVTSDYNSELKEALKAMILYSGSTFMDRTDYEKIDEIDIGFNRIAVVGTEYYSGTVKSSFIDDSDNHQFERYNVDQSPDANSRASSIMKFPQPFIIWSGISNVGTDELGVLDIDIVLDKDLDLLYNTGKTSSGGWIYVDKFRKLTQKEYLNLLGEYFNVYVKEDSLSPLQSIFAAVGGFFGAIIDFAYKISSAIPFVRASVVALTFVINELFNTDLDEEYVFKMAMIIAITLVIGYLTGSAGAAVGESIAVSAGIAGAGVAIGIAVSFAFSMSTMNEMKALQQSMVKESGMFDEDIEEKRAEVDAESKEREQDSIRKQWEQQEIDLRTKEQKEEDKLFFKDPLINFKNDIKRIRLNDVKVELESIKKIGKIDLKGE